MEDNNRNRIGSYIPQEIPIPDVKGNGQQIQNGPYQNDPPQHNPYQHNPYQNNSYQHNPHQHNPYQAVGGTGKRRSSGTIIGVICAIALLVVIITGAAVYYRSTPEYRISRGLRNLAGEIAGVKNPLLEKTGLAEIAERMQDVGGHVKSSVNLSAEMPLVGTTTLGIDTDYYKDMDAKKMSADTSFSVMNYEFAHLAIFADEDRFCFSVPELFLENMYIDNENVVSQYNESVFGTGGYASDLEDFSINLFDRNSQNKAVFDILRSLDTLGKRLAADVDACRKGMEIGKAGKGLYRMRIPGKETNSLLKNFAGIYEDVYGLQDEIKLLNDHDEVVGSDIILLFEIDRYNRIESIALEEPVTMLDGTCRIDGTILFLGENRSIDRIQGKLTEEIVHGTTGDVIFQLQFAPEQDDYGVELEVRAASEDTTIGKIKYILNCDAEEDTFDLTLAWQDNMEDIDVAIEGSVDHIVHGRNMEVDIEKAVISMNGEEVCRASGDIVVEPLQAGVRENVKADTAFFEMTWMQWADVIDKIDKAYGSLLNSLW